MAGLAPGGQVKVDPPGTYRVVYELVETGGNETYVLDVDGRRYTVPASWCEPVKRPALLTVASNMVEDSDGQHRKTAYAVLSEVVHRLSGAGFATAADWLETEIGQ